jgi:lipopolysaccharide transport system permease protein
VVFPAEILPLVTVLANGAHFVVALPILAAVLLATGHFPGPAALWVVPLLLIQLLLTTGLALAASALAVLFRDVRDILAHLLTFGFFATPIIYQVEAVPERFRDYLRFNPMAQVVRGWQDVLFFGHAPSLPGLAGAAVAAAICALAGYALFNRLRELFPEEV